MEKRHIYFHGTTLPVGAASKELRRPTLERPFFVADNPDAAIDYAIEARQDNASIFIMVSKRPLSEIAFDMSATGDMKALSGKFPSLVEFVHLYRDTDMFTKYSGKRSFYDVVDNISTSLSYSSSNAFSYEDSDMRRKLIGKILSELGLARVSDNTVIFGNELKTIIKKVNSREEGGLRDLRRLIKSKVFQEIYRQGFKVAMDDDTTSMRLDGNEYAVFDMDVFQSGFSNSVPLEGIKSVIRKIGEMK